MDTAAQDVSTLLTGKRNVLDRLMGADSPLGRFNNPDNLDGQPRDLHFLQFATFFILLSLNIEKNLPIFKINPDKEVKTKQQITPFISNNEMHSAYILFTAMVE